jgi:hypothetical protein
MTIEEHLEDLERELGRVKRRNRWLLGAIFLVAGVLIAPRVFETTAIRAQAQGAETAKQVRARSFILEDEKGKLRAVLAVTKDGPGLSLSDENGIYRAVLTLLKSGPSLSLSDENGKRRAEMTVLKEGPSLVLLNKNGKVIWSTLK